MATLAIWARRFEYAAGVTGLASDVRVCPVQNEACTEMIESLLRGRFLDRQQHEQCRRSEYQGRPQIHFIHHCIDLTSRKFSAEWQRPQSGPNSPS